MHDVRSHAFYSFGPFHVPGLAAPRIVRVYVPQNFSRKRLPDALIVFDGQNVFGDRGSFAGGWHMDTTLDRMAPRKKRLPLLVAVHHGGEHRIDELSPFAHGGHAPAADLLVHWLAEDLAPFVRREFGVAPSTESLIVGGSSMGGLAALFAYLRRPDVFGGAMCMSPSLWIAHGAMFDWVRRQPLPATGRIYIDCGGREAGGRMLDLAQRMAHELRARGLDSQRLMWRADPRGAHNERAWGRRVPKAVRFLFPSKAPRRTRSRAHSIHPMAEPDIW